MPVQEIDIGAPSVAQRHDEARRAAIHLREAPEAFDVLHVIAREAVRVGVEHIERVTEFVVAIDALRHRGSVVPNVRFRLNCRA